MNKPLLRSHRAIGYEVARTMTDDGTELVILQTAPHAQTVSPAHMLMPVTDADRQFEARMQLIQAIEKARFLGLDMDALRQAFDEALQTL